MQNEIVYQKPEDFEFRVVKAGTEQLPYKNGKTAECFVGENNCVQLDRVFPLSGTKKNLIGVIVTKKNQSLSLGHRTGGVSVPDLQTIQNAAIAGLLSEFSREVLQLACRSITATRNFFAQMVQMFKDTVTMQAIMKIVIQQVVETRSFAEAEIVNTTALRSKAVQYLNNIISEDSIKRIVAGSERVTKSNRTSQSGKKRKMTLREVTGDDNDDDEILDDDDKVDDDDEVWAVPEGQDVKSRPKLMSPSSLFKLFEENTQCAVFFDRDLGPCFQPINYLTREDFAEGNICLILQKDIQLQSHNNEMIQIQSGARFAVKRVSSKTEANSEGVLLVGSFPAVLNDDQDGLEDLLGSQSLRHTLFLAAVSEIQEETEYSFTPTPPEFTSSYVRTSATGGSSAAYSSSYSSSSCSTSTAAACSSSSSSSCYSSSSMYGEYEQDTSTPATTSVVAKSNKK